MQRKDTHIECVRNTLSLVIAVVNPCSSFGIDAVDDEDTELTSLEGFQARSTMLNPFQGSKSWRVGSAASAGFGIASFTFNLLVRLRTTACALCSRYNKLISQEHSFVRDVLSAD